MTGIGSNEIDGAVNVDITTVEGPELVSVGGGAIKITVGNTRLNRFQNEDEISWGMWDPEYVGDSVALDISQLLDIAIDVHQGNIERYEVVTQLLEGFRYYFLIEPLGDTVVRLAFQTREQIDPALSVPTPSPQSARGYVVDNEDFIRALLNGYNELLSAASNYGVEHQMEPGREQATMVESLLED